MFRWLLPLTWLALLQACAQVQSQRLATAPDAPAVYELQAYTLGELQAQVQRLCPNGHKLLRLAHAQSRLERESNLQLGAWQGAVQLFGAGDAMGAQATVQCTA